MMTAAARPPSLLTERIAYQSETKSGSRWTRRWREMDSNFRFLVARPSNRHGRSDRFLETWGDLWGTRGFEPLPLQGRVGCELDFLNHGRRRPFVCHDMAFGIWVGLSPKETRSRGWGHDLLGRSQGK